MSIPSHTLEERESYKIGLATIYKNPEMVKDYIKQCTQFNNSVFVPIETESIARKVSYADTFKKSVYITFGNLKKKSQSKLESKNKNSIVTLRIYECVIISAILISTEAKILAQYHYFKPRDSEYVGVDKFIQSLKKFNSTQIQIELASSFLSDPLIIIAKKISDAQLPLQRIYAKRLVVLVPGWRYVADPEKEITPLLLVSSIGVKVHLSKGISVFFDQKIEEP